MGQQPKESHKCNRAFPPVTTEVNSQSGRRRTKLVYDSLDRLTQENNNNGTVSYGYNDVGLRTNMTVTGENTVFYKYDSANRLTNVTQGTFTTSLFYDDGGRRTKMILPNGINVLYSYDTASRLTNITYQAAVTNKIDYAYDETGNRVSQLSALAAYLLPTAVSTGTYNFANQQLTFGSYNILYDSDGNVTNIISGTTTNRLLWSARNQLTNMLGAVTATFAYDGLGRRVTRTVSGNTEKYLYDGLDIISQLDSSSNVRGRYFRGLAIDEPWQRIDITPGSGQKTTETNRNYLADALGSIVALADSNKAIQTEYDYQPFGTTTNSGAGNKNSYKFTAREDDGTGLYYYRERYYQPVLGRFAAEDPDEMSGAPNIYLYVINNPIRLTDPYGLAFGDVNCQQAVLDLIKALYEFNKDFVGATIYKRCTGKDPNPNHIRELKQRLTTLRKARAKVDKFCSDWPDATAKLAEAVAALKAGQMLLEELLRQMESMQPCPCIP
jgi:RHS repeat-associated protein